MAILPICSPRCCFNRNFIQGALNKCLFKCLKKKQSFKRHDFLILTLFYWVQAFIRLFWSVKVGKQLFSLRVRELWEIWECYWNAKEMRRISSDIKSKTARVLRHEGVSMITEQFSSRSWQHHEGYLKKIVSYQWLRRNSPPLGQEGTAGINKSRTQAFKALSLNTFSNAGEGKRKKYLQKP